MPGHGPVAAAERCQVQPEGVSGSLAAECAGGHGDKTGPAEGWGLLYSPFHIYVPAVYVIRHVDTDFLHYRQHFQTFRGRVVTNN